MSYCINPQCNTRPNEAGRSRCQSCGTSLLIGDATKRYRLLRPLRPLDSWSATEIFEAELVPPDWTETTTQADRPATVEASSETQVMAASEEVRVANVTVKTEGEPPSAETTGNDSGHDSGDNHLGSDRRVLKLLKQERLLPLFKQEAEALAQLNHAGIPSLEPDGLFIVNLASLPEPMYCLVMEYIEGETLERWLANHGPIKQKQAEDWLRQIAHILQHLHQHSLFHRDIQLSNLLRRSNGQLALIDFGTVQPITDTYLAQIGAQGDVISGVSPGYTAPEQINGKAVPQSDFYAVGRSLIHLLSGQHPAQFEADADGQIEWQSSVPKLSKKLTQLLNDLTAPLPGQRPATADLIVQRLDHGLRAVPNSMLKPKIVGLMALNLGLLLLHMFMFGRWHAAWQDQQRTPPNLEAPTDAPTANTATTDAQPPDASNEDPQ